MHSLMTSFSQSMHGRGNFSSVRTSMCALDMYVSSLISCWFFQVFHILLFFNQCPDSAGRKLHFRKCCHGPIANQPFMWGKGNMVFQFSINPKFNYRRILSWMAFYGVAYICLIFFLWLPSCWWMWQKYTAVTVHDSTPLHKIFVEMSFKSNWSCILSAHRATEPSLRCWVMMSCLANHPGDGKMENKGCRLKNVRRQRLEETVGRFLAGLFFFFKLNNLLEQKYYWVKLYWRKQKSILVYWTSIFWVLSNC